MLGCFVGCIATQRSARSRSNAAQHTPTVPVHSGNPPSCTRRLRKKQFTKWLSYLGSRSGHYSRQSLDSAWPASIGPNPVIVVSHLRRGRRQKSMSYIIRFAMIVPPAASHRFKKYTAYFRNHGVLRIALHHTFLAPAQASRHSHCEPVSME